MQRGALKEQGFIYFAFFFHLETYENTMNITNVRNISADLSNQDACVSILCECHLELD